MLAPLACLPVVRIDPSVLPSPHSSSSRERPRDHRRQQRQKGVTFAAPTPPLPSTPTTPPLPIREDQDSLGTSTLGGSGRRRDGRRASAGGGGRAAGGVTRVAGTRRDARWVVSSPTFFSCFVGCSLRPRITPNPPYTCSCLSPTGKTSATPLGRSRTLLAPSASTLAARPPARPPARASTLPSTRATGARSGRCLYTKDHCIFPVSNHTPLSATM